jgi:hypothetical protein
MYNVHFSQPLNASLPTSDTQEPITETCRKGRNESELHLRGTTWLKGTVSRDFSLLVFSSISSPQPQSIPLGPFQIFENSQRYSQLKVDQRCRWHRWKMRKIFNQKNFNNFIGTPLDSRVNTYCIYIFAFKFTLRYLQPDINPIVCHRCQRWYQWQFATGVVDRYQ